MAVVYNNVAYGNLGGVRDQYFAEDPWGGPIPTPDGYGAFHFYRGGWGVGAIYYYESQDPSIRSEAHVIYGDILTSWANQGYETKKGYPYMEEFTAQSAGLGHRCPVGNREQYFVKFNGAGKKASFNLACWNPSNRKVKWSKTSTPLIYVS